ncbi:16S rRNA methyltransferase [Palaeococcus ferrophilus]|uniref:16S rRNA methyltransferase n=1 Tax=Palaeococcus ferrophilus TaxID=83868 RepID=UPI00064F36AB|nr:16S rRNA methyltransferase [Palaeococcus ferrophilus]
MLHVVIAESELELVPGEITGHPQVRSHARRRGKRPEELLLDATYHYRAMKGLPEWERRGRPDIVHLCLLNALESIAGKEGLLRVYVHTRNDEVIHVKPETRIPKNYNRFVGLMEELFRRGAVPKDLELLRIERKSLGELLEELGGEVFVMHERGELVNPVELAEELDGAVVVIGGFPHGDFRRMPKGRRVSVYPRPLTAWAVLNEVVISYGHAHLWKLLKKIP